MEPNHLILGRYQVLERLGEGASGEVFRGFDRRLGRPVAIKAIHVDRLADPATRRRMEREVRAVASLDHPHIVQMLDSGEEDGRFFAVMGLVEGRTLERRLREDGPLSPTLVAEIVVELAGALDHAHAQDCIHRDVKPSNIMLTDEGRPVLLDFGLATSQRITGLTASTGIGDHYAVGTPWYMSPEQVRGAPPTPATDQWSLAVVAYQLLTGDLPWRERDHPPALFVEILLDDPQPITGKRPELSSAVWRAFSRALEREPEHRYPTMTAFAEDLASAIRTGVTRTGRWAFWQRRLRRRARLAGGAALGALAASIAVAAVAFHGERNAGGPSQESPGEPPSQRAGSLSAAALFEAGATLACPVFASDESELAWLGAGAADLACRRLRWTRPDEEDEGLAGTRPPADLLGLPRQASADDPVDLRVYDDPGVREASLAEARRATDLVLDGRVAHDPTSGRIRIALHVDGRGGESPPGIGTGQALYQAVSAALDDLFGPDDPGDRPATSATHRAFGFDDLRDGWRLEDLADAIQTGRGVETACRGAAQQHPLPPPALEFVDACRRWRDRQAGSLEAGGSRVADPTDRAPDDRAAAAARGGPAPGRDLLWSAMLGAPRCVADLSDCLRGLDMADLPSSAEAQAMRFMGKALVYERLERPAESAAALTRALDLWPSQRGAREMVVAARLRGGRAGPWLASLVAWQPGAAGTWMAVSKERPTPELVRRAYVITGGHPIIATRLGSLLIAMGRVDDGLVIAHRLRMSEHPGEVTGGVVIQTRRLMSEGRFAAALDEASRHLLELDAFGEASFGDTELLGLTVDLLDLLSGGDGLTAQLIDHLITGPQAIVDDAALEYAALPLIGLCLQAPAEGRLGQTCVEELARQLEREARDEVIALCLEAASSHVAALRGEDAASLFRRLLRTQDNPAAFSYQACDLPWSLVEAYDLQRVTGALEVAPEDRSLFGGSHPATAIHLLAATASGACTTEERRQLEAVLDAWERADAAFPLLERVRARVDACRRAR